MVFFLFLFVLFFCFFFLSFSFLTISGKNPSVTCFFFQICARKTQVGFVESVWRTAALRLQPKLLQCQHILIKKKKIVLTNQKKKKKRDEQSPYKHVYSAICTEETFFFFLSILNRFLFPYKLNNLQSERENKNKHKNTKFLHAPHTRTHTET